MPEETRMYFTFQDPLDRDEFVPLAKREPGITIVQPVVGGCIVRVISGSDTIDLPALRLLANKHRGRNSGPREPL